MIEGRPAHLLSDPAYSVRPPLPYRIDWAPVPDLIRKSIADLGGIQPITRAMFDAAGRELRDQPSKAEVALFRDKGTEFQMISIVANLIDAGSDEGVKKVTPFALTLIPAQKRGEVSLCSIDQVAAVDLSAITQEVAPVYVGYDPFKGDWSIYGAGAPGLVGGQGHLDEVGLVVDAFYLATDFDPDDVLAPSIGMPTGRASEKYLKRRRELLFRPFQKPEARRIWGAESPIELFLLQELARHGLHPQLQTLIMEDGGVFPSWYHLWQDLGFRHASGLVTEADMFFTEQRVAVFCDGGNFHRGAKAREREERISAKLGELGIKSVRVRGREIVRDLAAAGQKVLEAL